MKPDSSSAPMSINQDIIGIATSWVNWQKSWKAGQHYTQEQNEAVQIAAALLERDEKLRIAVEELKRIENMHCIQHMPSCSDIAFNALSRILPLKNS